MDFLRWELEVLRYAWYGFSRGVREHVVIEVGVSVAGAIVGLWQTEGDPLGALVGGVSVALALGVGIGIVSLATAPYRLYRDKVPPAPSVLRVQLEKTAGVGRAIMQQPVVSDTDREQWDALMVDFATAFSACKPLMGNYTWRRIASATCNPTVRYPEGLNEEQGAGWLHIRATVDAIDEYIDGMDG